MADKLFRKQVWDILQESKPTRFKNPDINVALQTICKKMGVQDDDDMMAVLRTEIDSFVRFKKTTGRNPSIRGDCPNGHSIVFTRDEHEPIEDPMEIDDTRDSNKTKSFFALGKTGKHNHTKPLMDMLDRFIKEEEEVYDRSRKDVPMLSKTKLLGYLIQRVNYNSDRKISEAGTKILNELEVGVTKFDDIDAITLMHDLVLSKEQMRTMRKYLIKKGVFFPSTTVLLESRKKLKPVVSPILTNKGVTVDYVELVKLTTASVLDVVTEKEGINESTATFVMEYKSGGDGAGSQTVWKSRSSKGAAANMFQYSLSPLKLSMVKDDITRVLWKNPAPNSANWVRPIMLIREKEDAEDLLNHVVPYTDQSRSFFNSEKVNVSSWRTGKTSSVQHVIQDTMKDLKFKKKLCGLGGADCILCETRQCDWMNEQQINEGFPIMRTAAENLDIYTKLIEKDSGRIVPEKGDYPTRKGITQMR